MKTIFLDMDGVVADFNAYAKELVGYTAPGKRYPPKDWDKIKVNPRLYRELPVIEGSEFFVERVRQLANENELSLKFLSAVPRQNDVGWVFWDKIEWCKTYFPGIPVWFGPYSRDKHVHCVDADILIDDREDNIQDWTQVGGVGILHTDFITSIRELEHILVDKQPN